jgi:hypothetical protein
MVKEHKSSNSQGDSKKGRPISRRTAIVGLVLAVLIIISGAAALLYNNVSTVSDAVFAKRVDTAIESAEKWVKSHRMDILEEKNTALFKMLSECDELKANPLFKEIIRNLLETKSRSECWKRLIDPNWPVDKLELNRTIEKESIDNKWVLYAIATEEAKVTAEEMHLFDPQRWQRRQLTHQLNALVTLKKRSRKTDEKLDELIEHLCGRLSSELVFDMAVVDIYIQKVTFVLRAGHPEKIRVRWVERIIANQLSDGGWNDKWFCFTSGRRPMLGFTAPPSDQHATIQALTSTIFGQISLSGTFWPEGRGLR